MYSVLWCGGGGGTPQMREWRRIWSLASPLWHCTLISTSTGPSFACHYGKSDEAEHGHTDLHRSPTVGLPLLKRSDYREEHHCQGSWSQASSGPIDWVLHGRKWTINRNNLKKKNLKGNTGRVMYLGRERWWGWRSGKIRGRGNWSRWKRLDEELKRTLWACCAENMENQTVFLHCFKVLE